MASHDTDPVIAIDWPRPDFRVATLEFLIGLLATACPPEDVRAWFDGWEQPPDPATLNSAFALLAPAFELDGNGPRFMQDQDDLVSEAEPVERLLIESPGASTVAKNTDLLVHRGRVPAMGRAAAAMALYTFQSWAPAGGAGNRTGLRGGGPMVTIVLPGSAPTLWQMLWANVPYGEPAGLRDLGRIFPWLAPTVTSKEARLVTPESAHPLQCWWGMPRRIRLDFADVEAPQPCGLTGAPDTVSVASWRQRPHGPNYAAWGGVHPLTPSYQLKPATEVLSLHPQPGGIGYRHWLGLVMNDVTRLRRPAAAVVLWHTQRGLDVQIGSRLLAAGFDMDNMKARGFVESEMPIPALSNRATQERVDALAVRLVRSAEQVAGLLRFTVRIALFSAGATVRQNLEILSTMRERLWSDTEPAFFDLVNREAAHVAAVADAGATDHAAQPWLALLRTTALRLFDEAAPMEPDCAPLMRAGESVPRLVRARRQLTLALRGIGKEGELLFATLGLPATAKASKKRKAA